MQSKIKSKVKQRYASGKSHNVIILYTQLELYRKGFSRVRLITWKIVKVIKEQVFKMVPCGA